jgi:hypothetical protein
VLVVVCLSFLFVFPSSAQINSDLSDPYLDREFDWAMFVDARELKDYLKYPGSKLYPVTNVRVTFRSIQRGINPQRMPTEAYEEIWYHDGLPIGLHRHRNLKLAPGAMGIIVLGSSTEESDRTAAMCNALIRLIMDVELHKAVISLVQVPREEYEGIALGLEKYGFLPESKGINQSSPNIHLRSSPKGRDEYYYSARDVEF